MAALGLVAGSFASVVVHRLPRGEGIGRGRSRCPACGHVLRAEDLVPLLSYLWRRGRCRYCGARIPSLYPLLEAGFSVGFVLLWITSPTAGAWIVRTSLFALVVALALTDLRAGTLPDAITITGSVLAIGYAAAGWSIDLQRALLGAGIGAATILAIAWVSRGGMGLGDAKMLAMIGAFLGPWGALGTLVWGSVLGSLVGAGLLLTGRATRKTRVPFGPFLAAGAALAHWTLAAWGPWLGLP